MVKEHRRQRHHRQSRRRRRGLSSLQEKAIKAKLRGGPEIRGVTTAGDLGSLERPPELPSSAWIDACFISIDDVGPDGVEIVTRLYEPTRFPAGLMMRCLVCGVPTPLSGIDRAKEVCLDCHCARTGQEGWPQSAFSMAMAALRRYGIKLKGV